MDYRQNIASKFISEDKWLRGNTTKGINLHFGLLEPDLFLFNPVTLNYEQPHLLLHGPKGTGKTQIINALLATLLVTYPVDELAITYISDREVNVFSWLNSEGLGTDNFKPMTTHNDSDLCYVLDSLLDATEKRSIVLDSLGSIDYEAYRMLHKEAKLNRHLLIVDVHNLSSKAVELLHAYMATGASNGYHLILSLETPNIATPTLNMFDLHSTTLVKEEDINATDEITKYAVNVTYLKDVKNERYTVPFVGYYSKILLSKVRAQQRR